MYALYEVVTFQCIDLVSWVMQKKKNPQKRYLLSKLWRDLEERGAALP